ncbi:hypothetical protein Fmac_009167 [Flemingia macrophylla]|uniref:Uncharacterized protein n=1 Tax=Flemingia macrophylla TaxID=520843 RepID=A0ABD1MZG9_9FABA
MVSSILNPFLTLSSISKLLRLIKGVRNKYTTSISLQSHFKSTNFTKISKHSEFS